MEVTLIIPWPLFVHTGVLFIHSCPPSLIPQSELTLYWKGEEK